MDKTHEGDNDDGRATAIYTPENTATVHAALLAIANELSELRVHIGHEWDEPRSLLHALDDIGRELERNRERLEERDLQDD